MENQKLNIKLGCSSSQPKQNSNQGVPSYRFRVSLTSGSPEVNFRGLIKNKKEDSKSVDSIKIEDTQTHPETFEKDRDEDNSMKQDRYSIIERLEKKYGTGDVSGNGYRILSPGAKKQDDREHEYDCYDSDDSFIDDSELQQGLAKSREKSQIQTKYDGFFVNAGRDIEVVPNNSPAVENEKILESNPPKKRPGSSKKEETTRSIKMFLSDWAVAAAEWKPGEKIEAKIEKFEKKAARVFAENSPKFHFPRELDEELREIDKLVLEAHPNKWRTGAYFARLMQFLPFTKNTLKASMLRLESRDAAYSAKKKFDECIRKVEYIIKQIIADQSLKENTKADLQKVDHTFRRSLFELMASLDVWVNKANEFRNLLKSIDKKKMPVEKTKILGSRQEKNRMFNQLIALFPPGSVDVSDLRQLCKTGKRKRGPSKTEECANEKPTQPKSKDNTSTVPKYIPKEPISNSTKLVKKNLPPKTRKYQKCPMFVLSDFDDILVSSLLEKSSEG